MTTARDDLPEASHTVRPLIEKLRAMQRPGSESDLTVMCAEAADALTELLEWRKLRDPVTLQDLRGDEAKEQALWAERGRWLAEKLSERTTPDGRTVLELVDEPIWVRADGTFADYCAAVDAAMEADDGWATAGL